VTTILLVEDDPALRRALRTMMRSRDLEVLDVGTGEDAVVVASSGTADLMVLDLGLPDIDGLEVLQRIRAFSAMPVIVLTAHHQQSEKIRALDLGADDYVTKPFEIAELAARLRALMRRAERETPAEERLTYDDVVLDTRRHQVTRDGEALALTPIEYRLLEYFMRNPEVVLSREAVLLNVWGYQGGESNYLDVHVGHLREKIEAGGRPRLIQTVRAFGYALQKN